MSTQIAYLGLGGNLGDPIQQIITARHAIYQWDYCLNGRCSYFYLSSPVGYADQADFVNCAIQIHTSADPYQLLDFCQQLEIKLGRHRDPNNQNAARIIDIDILMIGDLCISDSKLELPHPRMKQRLFVLLPLLDVLEPDKQKSVQYECENGSFGDQRVYRLLV